MQSKRISSSVASAHAASLQFQYRLFLRELGTLIPETIPLREISRVLDVACGPGSWIVDLAEAHPSMKITGIDKNPEMIRIAQESLSADKARRVTLDVGDILKWLPYSNDYFDFVHLHKASNFIIPQQWPAVVAELLRVLRPGGWINLVGFEPGVTSSPAIDSFVSLVSKALLQAGRSTSPEGSAITAAVLYPNFLRQAGYIEVKYTLHPVNLGGWNNPAGRAYMQAMLSDDLYVIPFLIKMGMLTQDEAKDLLARMHQEIQQIDYCGAGMLISVVGRKPAA